MRLRCISVVGYKKSGMGTVMDDYWWIETGVPSDEKNSGCIRYSVTSYSYSQIKKSVWKLYRTRTDRADLSCYDKMLLWAISERFRVRSMSCTDAVGYLAKMIGVSRKTAGKSMRKLVDNNIIWLAEEGSERKAHRKLEARKYFKKHILIVGLSFELVDG